MFLAVLEHKASTIPRSKFALFEEGDEWTFEETLREVKRTAKALKVLGVKEGDCVGVWLPNSRDLIRVWFAINYLGAIQLLKGRLATQRLVCCIHRLNPPPKAASHDSPLGSLFAIAAVFFEQVHQQENIYAEIDEGRQASLEVCLPSIRASDQRHLPNRLQTNITVSR